MNWARLTNALIPLLLFLAALRPTSADTLYWFAPLPPMPERPGRRYTGSSDFMALFSPDAPWQKAARHIQVFKLYGEWVYGSATDKQLKQVVNDLRRRGIALAVEGGPLKAQGCGAGVEGFAEPQWARIAARIKAAGGTIDYIDMDEPYYHGHFYDGRNACRWSTAIVAHRIDAFIKEIRKQFPKAVVGDAEPLAGRADADAYRAWIDAFRKINGFALPYLHMDVDWRRPDWPQEIESIEDHGHRAGVPVGIIYTGNAGDQSAAIWLANAGERVKQYEIKAGGHPAHVLFQSWDREPTRLLPETAKFTFTHFIDQYFVEKVGLGYASSPEIDLAYGKKVAISRSDGTHIAAFAVDGDPVTYWTAGAFPPQWIEIDLGQPHDIKAIKLITAQTPPGPTMHEVYGKGPGTKGVWRLLHRFHGYTADDQVLEQSWPHPFAGIEWIRVVTTRSPSWVGWREIQVIGRSPEDEAP
jgi:hypothetical protein